MLAKAILLKIISVGKIDSHVTIVKKDFNPSNEFKNTLIPFILAKPHSSARNVPKSGLPNICLINISKLPIALKSAKFVELCATMLLI